jgi:radical SAM protein with 4Fe4S-binding SPASM domain
MHDNMFFSFKGKILKKESKNFIIVIWPDVPFYIALPRHYENFIKEILVSQFEYTSVKSFLYEEKHENLFNYLIENGILSKKPLNTITPSYNIKQLYYISLQVTEQCNLRCSHCYASAGENIYNQDLSTDQITNIIEKLVSFSDIDKCSFIITGGEPFLRNDILNIINFAIERFKNVVVVTNGLLLSDNIIKELSKIENIALQVSLDGASQETHELIRGDNTYNPLINNIRKLIDHNIKVALSPICTEIFFKEIDEYFKLAKNLKVSTVQLQPVQYIGRALVDKNIKRVDGAKLINKVVQYYFDENYSSLISNGLESISVIHVRNLNKLISCGTGHGTMYVGANGNIYSCPNMANNKYTIGNVLQDDIKDLYYTSPIYKELRGLNINKDYDESCVNCEVKHFCGGGCRGVSVANNNNLYGKAIECSSLRSYFEEIIWKVCENRDFFSEESKKWLLSKNN